MAKTKIAEVAYISLLGLPNCAVASQWVSTLNLANLKRLFCRPSSIAVVLLSRYANHGRVLWPVVVKCP